MAWMVPFLRSIDWFVPWGYFWASILVIIVAIGILLICFKKARKDLSDSEARFRLLAENARDIEELKRAEEKLRAAHQQLFDIIDFSIKVLSSI